MTSPFGVSKYLMIYIELHDIIILAKRKNFFLL